MDEVVLVSDEERCSAARLLYSWGLLAEVSGCASVAAVMFDKLGAGNIQSKLLLHLPQL